MFKKRLEIVFVVIVFLSILVLVKNYYDDYNFKNNPIPDEYKKLILLKEQEVLQNMRTSYGYSFKVPLIITDKFKNKLYGITSYKNGSIKIYLNKNVMKESMDYMLDSVIAHEYAHALMFKQGHLHVKNDGHSKEWTNTCIKLGGINCEQYVNVQEVVMGKMPF